LPQQARVLRALLLAYAILFAGLHERISTATFPTNQTKDTPAGSCLPKNRDLKLMTEMADFFQKEAQQCKRLAAQASGKKDREYWSDLAERWESLAQQNGGIKLENAQPPERGATVLEKRFAKRRAA
jgi:hypothetical protein